MDYRIDWAELIYLRGDVACLLEVGEVADDRRRPAGDQSCSVSRRSLSRVDDHVMATVQHRFRGQSIDASRGTGDEDARQVRSGS